MYHIKRAILVNERPDWDRIEEVQINEHLWLAEIDTHGFAKVCYDESGIYVKLEVKEKEIRATYQGKYDMVSQDSCLEFYFCPIENDPRYFNIEYNPNGALYLGYGTDRYRSVRIILHDEKSLFQGKPYYFEGGWGVEYKVPTEFFELFVPGFTFQCGMKLRGNFYKCGDYMEQPHFIAWNEVIHETPEFNKPEYFGNLYFD